MSDSIWSMCGVRPPHALRDLGPQTEESKAKVHNYENFLKRYTTSSLIRSSLVELGASLKIHLRFASVN
jgi:hypothetical protein